jgi:hypothetical protein
MAKLLVALAVVFAAVPAHADDEPPPPSVLEEEDRGTPELSVPRLLGEAALGGLFAVGGGFGGAYMGYYLETGGKPCGDLCGFGGFIVGGLVGLAVAPPIGVYLAGSYGDETGSFALALGGSILGTIVGAWASHELDDANAPGVAVVAPIIAGPVLGSMLGFNLTRRYDEPRTNTTWMPVASATAERAMLGIAGEF